MKLLGFFKRRIKNNSGSSLIELMLGVTIFTIVAVGITNMLASANRQTMENKRIRVSDESVVGAMDSMVEPSVTLDNIDESVTNGLVVKEDYNVSVTFPGAASAETVTAIKVRDAERRGIAIVKFKN